MFVLALSVLIIFLKVNWFKFQAKNALPPTYAPTLNGNVLFVPLLKFVKLPPTVSCDDVFQLLGGGDPSGLYPPIPDNKVSSVHK